MGSGWGARAAAGLWLAAALAAPSGAEVVVIAPGPEGEDVAPYQFLPSALRGDSPGLWAFSEPGHGFETFLRFPLPPDLLGPDEEVGLALLSLEYAKDSTSQGQGSNEPGVLECREVLSPWAEASVTWTSRPSYGPPVDVVEGIVALGPLTCDVTSLVADWALGVRSNHGFAVTNPTRRLMGFFSFEALEEGAIPPVLYVDVVPVPEPGAGAGGLAAAAGLAALARCLRRPVQAT